MKRITVNMQDICHHKLSVFAAYTQKSINDVVLDALKEHVTKHPRYEIIAKDLLQHSDTDCCNDTT
tara:strand:- start:185 stop:382 length:198 start_codon:yes stop_codon:yes gene_type:complete